MAAIAHFGITRYFLDDVRKLESICLALYSFLMIKLPNDLVNNHLRFSNSVNG